MNSTIVMNRPSRGLQRAGTVACWIGTSALLAVSLSGLAFFAVLSSDAQQGGTIGLLGRAIGPYLGIIALFTFAFELAAITSFAFGAVRWHCSIVRSPRWIASGLCTSIAGIATLVLGALYVLIATAYV